MFLSETHCRLELNFMISWGMVSDEVIVVSELVDSQSFKRIFPSSRLLQQKTKIYTTEKDIVAGDVLLW